MTPKHDESIKNLGRKGWVAVQTWKLLGAFGMNNTAGLVYNSSWWPYKDGLTEREKAAVRDD